MAVVVYGATGFTGRLVCAELQRRKVRFAVAGRDRDKLTALVGVARRRRSPRCSWRALDDRRARSRRPSRADASCSPAPGPFARIGEPVREAALAARRHYLDITGENEYMLATAARDAEARARGVALVNAVGFDVVPTDAAAALAAEAVGGKPELLRIAIHFGGRATPGHHALGARARRQGRPRLHRRPVRARAGGAPIAGRRPFRRPIGDRVCVSIPWGDLATAPRSTGARTVRTYMAVSPTLARVMPLVGLARKALAWGPAKQLAERWVSSLPEGPSDAERARARAAPSSPRRRTARARRGPG